jgi:NADH-quinone oxidoreductase subunit J
MTIMQLIFLFIAAMTLIAALLVVTSRNLIHAALWLILTLFGVAVFYVLLSAGFFAVVQVIVYIGAIAILFIFAVMLTRRNLRESGPQTNSSWWLASLISLVLFLGIIVVLNDWAGFTTAMPDLGAGANSLEQLGIALVSPDAYVIPFELASVLLVAAMIGAIYVARETKS